MSPEDIVWDADRNILPAGSPFSRRMMDASLNAQPLYLWGDLGSERPYPVTMGAIDLGGPQIPDGIELNFEVPALPDSIMPLGATATYLVEACNISNFPTESPIVTLFERVVTGAGSGTPAVSTRIGLSNGYRYVRMKLIGGAGSGNASGYYATLITCC